MAPATRRRRPIPSTIPAPTPCLRRWRMYPRRRPSPTMAVAADAMSMPLPSLRFSKMHGAGNDFVVLDLRGGVSPPSPSLCRALADRHTGVGCDQILTVEDTGDGAV